MSKKKMKTINTIRILPNTKKEYEKLLKDIEKLLDM
jgi:hypothetical protein